MFYTICFQIQACLDADEYLLHRDGGPPALILVQNGEADGPAGVDVGMEESSGKLALCVRAMRKEGGNVGEKLHSTKALARRQSEGMHPTHLGWLGGVLLAKFHGERIESTLPEGVLLAGDVTVPFQQVCLPGKQNSRGGPLSRRAAGESCTP